MEATPNLDERNAGFKISCPIMSPNRTGFDNTLPTISRWSASLRVAGSTPASRCPTGNASAG